VLVKGVMRQQEELLRGIYEAFNRRDLDGLLQRLHPEIEVEETEDLAYAAALLRLLGPRFVVLSGGYRGHEEVTRVFETVWGISEWFNVEPKDFITANGCIIVVLTLEARALETGLEGEASSAHLWTLEDGKGRRLRVYADASKARKAALNGG
jgi:ketosteroid isomerase-like protein